MRLCYKLGGHQELCLFVVPHPLIMQPITICEGYRAISLTLPHGYHTMKMLEVDMLIGSDFYNDPRREQPIGCQHHFGMGSFWMSRNDGTMEVHCESLDHPHTQGRQCNIKRAQIPRWSSNRWGFKKQATLVFQYYPDERWEIVVSTSCSVFRV